MDTEDEFMSGMSESEADFQGEDSEEDLDMGSDDGELFNTLLPPSSANLGVA